MRDLYAVLGFVVKSEGEWINLEARAIAVFQYNNDHQFSPANRMIIPCISMFLRRPTFYKVPVTAELYDAVKMGEFSASPTIVERCVVTAHHIPECWGIELPEYRQLALPHFVAFHTLLKSCWPSFYPQNMPISGGNKTLNVGAFVTPNAEEE